MSAESGDAGADLARARRLIAEKSWADAESTATAALAHLEEAGEDVRTTGRTADAARRDSTGLVPHADPDSLLAADLIDAIVQARAAQGRLRGPGTVDLARRSAGIRERQLGSGHPAFATSLRSLSKVLYASGDLAGSLPLAERALAIHTETEDSTSLELAESLGNMAFFLGASGRPDSALVLYRRALRVQRAALGAEDPAVASTLHRIGFALAALGDYRGAIPPMEEALRIRRSVLAPEDPVIAASLNDLSLPHYYLGEYAAAESLVTGAIDIRRRALGPDHPDLAKSIELLALVHFGEGRLEEARQGWQRALEMRERIEGPEHRDVGAVLVNLSLVAGEMGEYEDCAALGERALRIYESALGPEHPLTGLTLNNLGSDYRDLGDYERAESCFERSLRVQEKAYGPDHPELASVLVNLGLLQIERGRLGEADTLLTRALAIDESALGTEHPSLAVALQGLGQLELSEGRIAEARAHDERALAILERQFGPGDGSVATPLFGLGELAEADGNLGEADSLYSRCLRIRIRSLGPVHPGVAEALVRLGGIAAARGRRGDALDLDLRAEAVAREHIRLILRTAPEPLALRFAAARVRGLDPALALLFGGSEAQLRRAWGELVESRALILDGMAERRRSLRSDGASSGLDSLRREWESSRRRLAHLVLRGAATADGESGQDFAAKLEQARRRAESAERALARAGFVHRDPASEPVGLDSVLKALPPATALVSYVRIDPGAAGVSGHRAAGRRAAPSRSEPFYAAFLFSPEGGRISFLPLGKAEEIESLVASWHDEAASGLGIPGRPDSVAEAAYRDVAGRLRRAVWDPVASRLGAVERVFIVPDGSLSLVNLATLPDDGGGYLVEHDPVLQYASAERDLAGTPAEPLPAGQEPVLALGNPDFDARSVPRARPGGEDLAGLERGGAGALTRSISCRDFRSTVFANLPQTEREIEQIAEISSQPVRLLRGAEANEAAFKRLSGGRRILHLATHGFFLGEKCRNEEATGRGERGVAGLVFHPGERPGTGGDGPAAGDALPPSENPLLLSGLALAGANARDSAGPEDEDGILTAEEIGTLDLDGTEWAVLSACETGVGVVQAAEGVLGLERAFRVAGARTVIMSLWPVQDESTRLWMDALYEARLRDGMDTAGAVRSAATSMIAAARSAGLSTHPFRWGAFIASGDWR